LAIYDLNGKSVRVIATDISSLNTSEIDWDGLDNNGNPLMQGAYIYRISAVTNEGHRAIGRGAMTLLRD
jgi:flagellar hook assembly protein FlgD